MSEPPARWLNVAAVEPWTRANGPGLRAAVWVQGCTLACPGCFNPHTHAHVRRRLEDPRALARDLLTDPAVEGLSLLGGEPFQQAAASADLCEAAQALGKSVWVWSGYAWPALQGAREPAVQRLLAATDVLCAGPYVARLHDPTAAWHGSTNQAWVFLSGREGPEALQGAQPRVELRLEGRGVRITGQSTRADRERLSAALGARLPEG